MTKLPAQCAIALAALLFVSDVTAAVTVLTGTATAGADIGTSPILGIPPSGRTQNVFYDFRDLTKASSGGLGAEGWATSSWNISQTTLTASGSSGQGFNDAYGAGGWIYGWGHASFSATLSLDQAYAYSAPNEPTSARGISGTYGFFDSGVHTVSGTTYGGQGGFSLNYQLTPANATQTAVLNGAINPPAVRQHSGNLLYYVIAGFIPQGEGMTLKQAANILGVDHFNYVNTIIGAPTAWQWYENTYVIIQSGDPIPSSGLVDPLPQVATGASRSITDPRSGVSESFDFTSDSFDGTPHFNNTVSPLYYNETYVTRADIVNGNELDFRDSPQMAPGMFQPGDAPLQFMTQLVGEDKNGKIIAYFGSPFYWSSDQTSIKGQNFTGTIFSASEPDEDDVGTWGGGGITIGVPPLSIEWIPAPISYGTVLSSTQLNAISSVPGWFAYAQTNGAVLNSGTNTLTVVFTPYDTVDYGAVTNSVGLVVAPAVLTLTASNASRAYDLANPVFTGAIVGLTNGDNIGVTYSCNATGTSPIGAYPIVPILVDPNNRATNYTVIYINGTLTVGPQPVNLVTNPGFEQMRTGWTFVGGAGVTPAPHTGSYAALVNIGTGSVSQPVATLPGHIYSVSFWLSANGFSAPGAIITASFDGVTGFFKTYPAGAFGYQQESFTFDASTTISLFMFSGVMSGGTFFLDDVSVIDLPVPGNHNAGCCGEPIRQPPGRKAAGYCDQPEKGHT